MHCKSNACLIGALTSKPYAFVARPWEVKHTDSVDVFDSIGGSIKIGSRGSSILRILPKVNDKVNEEWVTDKARFSYDSFKTQRIPHCFKKNDRTAKYITTNWARVFGFFTKSENTFFKPISKTNNFDRISFFVGPFADNETLQILGDIKQNYCDVQVLNNVLCGSTTDLRKFYIFPDIRVGIDVFFSGLKNIITVGLDLRLEAPILNLRLRRVTSNKKMRVYNIGFASPNNIFGTTNLGNSKTHIYKIFQSKSNISKIFTQNAKASSLLLFGTSFVQNKDQAGMLNFLCNNEYLYTTVQPEISSVGSYEAGITSGNKTQRRSINWFLDEDRTITMSGFSVYQGHHNDRNASRSNLILPTTLFAERNSNFYAFDGTSRKTKFIPPSSAIAEDIRDDFLILKNTFQVAGGSVNADRKITGSFCNLVSSNDVPKLFSVDRSGVSNYLQNFYRNDSITRNSPIMALVTSRSNNRRSIFRN